jgi:hypothetical protein
MWKIISKIAREILPAAIDPLKIQKIVASIYGDQNIMGDPKYSVIDATLDWALGIKFRNIDYVEQEFWRNHEFGAQLKSLSNEYSKKMDKVQNRSGSRYTDTEIGDKVNDLMLDYMEKVTTIQEKADYMYMQESDPYE